MGIHLHKGEACTWMAGHDPRTPGQTCRFAVDPPFVAPRDGWFDVVFDAAALTAALEPRAEGRTT